MTSELDTLGATAPLAARRSRRISRKKITSKDLADRARQLLYEKLDQLPAKELAALVVAELKLEEARARGKVPIKGDGEGMDDLKKRMRRAMAGVSAGALPGAEPEPESGDDAEAEE